MAESTRAKGTTFINSYNQRDPLPPFYLVTFGGTNMDVSKFLAPSPFARCWKKLENFGRIFFILPCFLTRKYGTQFDNFLMTQGPYQEYIWSQLGAILLGWSHYRWRVEWGVGIGGPSLKGSCSLSFSGELVCFLRFFGSFHGHPVSWQLAGIFCTFFVWRQLLTGFQLAPTLWALGTIPGKFRVFFIDLIASSLITHIVLKHCSLWAAFGEQLLVPKGADSFWLLSWPFQMGWWGRGKSLATVLPEVGLILALGAVTPRFCITFWPCHHGLCSSERQT